MIYSKNIKKFLVFGSPRIEKPEIREVVACLKSGWIGTGPRVARFEKDFARYKGAPHAVALNSGTAALHLSLLALGVKSGDEVIVPAMTFAATANAVIHAGARPVFADCGRRTMTLDPADVQRRITKHTRAIIPVHFAGRPCDMDELMTLAHRHRLKVIEDCAHAIESEYKGKKCGLIGDIGCFSFYVTKNVITGEGGMITTSSQAVADRVKVLALHGMSHDAWARFGDKGYKHYRVVSAGFKYNMTDLQASLGIHQLARIEVNARRRAAIWRRYQAAFKDLPVCLPPEPEKRTRHARHLYTLLVDTDKSPISRDELMKRLDRRGIGTGVHYTALHLHPFYQRTFGCRPGDHPASEWVSRSTLSLPLSPKLTDADVRRVIAAVRGSFHRR